MIEVKIIDRNNETFTYKGVSFYQVCAGGALQFDDSSGVRHVTNEEFHVTDKPDSK